MGSTRSTASSDGISHNSQLKMSDNERSGVENECLSEGEVHRKIVYGKCG